MRRSPLDDFTAERLLGGRLRPEDAPLGWEHVALLVEAASGPAEESELAAGASIAAAMADLILGDAEVVSLDSRRPGMARFRTARVAGVAAAVVLFTATAAAAAANSLPRPAQTAVSNAAATVGVSLPKPAPASDHDADDAPVSGASTSAPHPADHDPAIGAASTSPASTVLCQALAAGRGKSSDAGDVRKKLEDEAGATHESVADFCRGVSDGHPTTAKPAAPSTTAGRHDSGGDGDGGNQSPAGSGTNRSSGGPGGSANSQGTNGSGGGDGQANGGPGGGNGQGGQPNGSPGNVQGSGGGNGSGNGQGNGGGNGSGNGQGNGGGQGGGHGGGSGRS